MDIHPQLTKPGITTSELWFHVAAVALSAMIGSGVIPTTGPYAAIAMIIAAELSAFGYQAGRLIIKGNLAKTIQAISSTALIVLWLASLSSTLPACASGSTARKDLGLGVVAAAGCEVSNLTAQDAHDANIWAQDKVNGWISGTTPGDLAGAQAKILADLKPLQGQLLPCLINGIVAAIEAPPNPSSASSTATQALSLATPDAAHTVAIAFQLAARQAGWPRISTPGGAQ